MNNHEVNELSEREIEILRLVATGASNKEIAHKLVISPNTVKVHLRNIFTKIGAVSRTEAAMYAVNKGLVETPSTLNLFGSNNSNEKITITSEFLTILLNKYKYILILGLILIISFTIIFLINRNKTSPEPIISPQVPTLESKWQNIKSMPFARYAFASAVLENKIFIFGGVTDSGITDSVISFNLVTQEWQSEVPLPTPVSEIKATIINGKIYIPGGKTIGEKTTNQLQVFDPQTGIWSEFKSLPISFSGYAMANLDGFLYVFGGWDGSTILNSVYSYNPETDKWLQRSNLNINRVYAEAVTVSNKILVIGGYDGNTALNITDAYIPQNDIPGQNPWQSKTFLPKPIFGMGAISIGDFVYIAGGPENDDLLFYSEAQNQWQIANTSPFLKNEFPGMAAVGNYLYMFGGRNSKNDPIAQSVTYQALFIVQMPIITR